MRGTPDGGGDRRLLKRLDESIAAQNAEHHVTDDQCGETTSASALA